MPLSPKVQKMICDVVLTAGKELQDQLPPNPRHPHGRNAYAHIYQTIRRVMRKSYKDCEDHEAEQILDVIERCVKNPT